MASSTAQIVDGKDETKSENERLKDFCFSRTVNAFDKMIDRSGLSQDFVCAVSTYGNSADVAELIHRKIHSFLLCEYFEWTFCNSQDGASKFFWDGVRAIFTESGLNFEGFFADTL